MTAHLQGRPHGVTGQLLGLVGFAGPHSKVTQAQFPSIEGYVRDKRERDVAGSCERPTRSPSWKEALVAFTGIADRFDGCTIVLADPVGFTAHFKGKDPEQIVSELNTVFTRFDGSPPSKARRRSASLVRAAAVLTR